MDQNRTCPICENDFPSQLRFRCPYCHFEIKWFDDEDAVAKAKRKFKGILYSFDDGAEENRQETNTKAENGLDFPSIGVLGGSLGFVIAALGGQLTRNIFPQLLFTIILSISAGYIWEARIKRAWGCLFVIAIFIGIVAPVFLIFILFPGGF